MMFALFVSLLCWPVAIAQPPSQPQSNLPHKVQEKPTQTELHVMPFLYAVNEKFAAPTTVEEAIKFALVHHPDIRLAEAEMRVAEAKLAQARLQVTQKVSDDFQRLQQAKAKLKAVEEEAGEAQRLHAKGLAPKAQLDKANADLASVKSTIATQELGWQRIVGTQQCQACHGSGFELRSITTFDVKNHVHGNRILLDEVFTAVPSTVDTPTPTVSQMLKDNLTKKIKLEKQTQVDLSTWQAADEGWPRSFLRWYSIALIALAAFLLIAPLLIRVPGLLTLWDIFRWGCILSSFIAIGLPLRSPVR